MADSQLPRLVYGQIAALIRNPAHDMLTPIVNYCEGTEKPDETLGIITGFALSQYAKLLADVLGQEAALDHALDCMAVRVEGVES